MSEDDDVARHCKFRLLCQKHGVDFVSLSPMQACLLADLFGGRTVLDSAQRWKVSRSYAGRLEEKALKQLAHLVRRLEIPGHVFLDELEEDAPTFSRAAADLLDLRAAASRPYDENDLDRLGLSVRVRGVLRRGNVRSVEYLTKCTEFELMLRKNFGRGSLREVKEALQRDGLSLRVGARALRQAEMLKASRSWNAPGIPMRQDHDG